MSNILKLVYLFCIFIFINLPGYTYIEKVNEADSLTKKAKTLLENGKFNESIEVSKQARELLDFIDRMIPVVKKLNFLEHQIKVAKQIKAKEYAPKEFAGGNKNYLVAYDLLKKNDDIEGADKTVGIGIKLIQKAIEITRKSIEKKKTKKESVTEIVKVTDEKSFSYYEVRLNLRKRDSLWSIAGKWDVYGDPWKWFLIYDANRGKIKNPNLIYPKQKLLIPPVPDNKEFFRIKNKYKKIWTKINR